MAELWRGWTGSRPDGMSCRRLAHDERRPSVVIEASVRDGRGWLSACSPLWFAGAQSSRSVDDGSHGFSVDLVGMKNAAQPPVVLLQRALCSCVYVARLDVAVHIQLDAGSGCGCCSDEHAAVEQEAGLGECVGVDVSAS